MNFLNRIALMLMVFFIYSCYYEDIPRQSICTATDFIVSAVSQNASGCGKSDGSITASATGATGNYKFSIDGGKTKQSTGDFSGLGGGAYLVIAYDGACTDSTEVTVDVNGTNFTAGIKPNTISADTECLTDNGSVELQASGGTGPYSFKLGTVTNATGVFTGLKSGTYSASASDATCTLVISVVIPSDVSTSYSLVVDPILEKKCNYSDCHAVGNPKKLAALTTYQVVYNYRDQIRSKILNNTMPKKSTTQPRLIDLTSDELNLIVCWIDAGAQDN